MKSTLDYADAYTLIHFQPTENPADDKTKNSEMKKFLLMSFTFSDMLKLFDSVNDVAMTREFLKQILHPLFKNSKLKVY